MKIGGCWYGKCIFRCESGPGQGGTRGRKCLGSNIGGGGTYVWGPVREVSLGQ